MGGLLGQHSARSPASTSKPSPIDCRAGAEAPPVYQNELVVRCQRLHRGKRRRRIENIAVDEHNRGPCLPHSIPSITLIL